MTEELTVREQSLKGHKYNLEPECVVVTSWNLGLDLEVDLLRVQVRCES